MAKGRKVVASTDEYTILRRRDGRYAVEGADGKPINAESKIEILLKHDLIKAVVPAAPPAEEAAEEVAEEATDETDEDEAAPEAEAEAAPEGADAPAEGDAKS